MRSDNMPRPFAPEHSETPSLEAVCLFDRWHDATFIPPKDTDPYRWRIEYRALKEARRFVWDTASQQAADEIERLRDDVAQLRDLLEELEACREGSRVAHAELKALKAKIEAAPVACIELDGAECFALGAKPEDADNTAALVGKRVRLVVCDD